MVVKGKGKLHKSIYYKAKALELRYLALSSEPLPRLLKSSSCG